MNKNMVNLKTYFAIAWLIEYTVNVIRFYIMEYDIKRDLSFRVGSLIGIHSIDLIADLYLN